jgi:hypothetical protein
MREWHLRHEGRLNAINGGPDDNREEVMRCTPALAKRSLAQNHFRETTKAAEPDRIHQEWFDCRSPAPFTGFNLSGPASPSEVQADEAGMGLAPYRTMAAEDKRATGRASRSAAGQSSLPLTTGLGPFNHY